MRTLYLFVLLVFLLPTAVSAQLIWAEPTFPNDSEPVTIFFDATEGSAGLAGCNCDVYLHTGLITSESTTSGDWKYVFTQWGVANDAWKMTPVPGQPDVYSYEITPSIREHYGVTDLTEDILKLAFVFRNATGSVTGKDIGGNDIFYDVYPDNAGFSTSLLQPAESTIFAELNENITINLAASVAADVYLYDSGELLTQAGDVTDFNYVLTVTEGGAHLVEIVAVSGQDTSTESFTYVVPQAVVTEALPAGTQPGINYLSDTQVRLSLYAPEKEHVYLIGDFTDWQFLDEFQLKRTPDGNTWWTEVGGLTPGQFYAFQYVVDGNIRIGDPYSNLILDPSNDESIPAANFPNIPDYPYGKTSGIASLLQTAAPEYDWQVENFDRPVQENLVIYEILMRDFTHAKNYDALQDKLDYLQSLGVTAIELMPVNEFDGNYSWGYNPTYHYALDKFYGTPDAFKAVVDACHERGIAVILDVVFNHAHEKNPLAMLYWDAANYRPAPDNPWLNPEATHAYNVFFDFNHESPATKIYVKQTLRHWLEEYRVDGFRFDLSKGLTQNTNGPFDAGAYDATRIATLKDYADAVWATSPGAYVILEHFTANSEEEELSDYGAMLWGGAGLQSQYLEASMGFSSNFTGSSYVTKGWADPHVVVYMESHDEERVMYKNLNFGNENAASGYDVKELPTALDRVQLTSTIFFTIPGPKMLWQFEELGYDYSINTCTNGTVNNVCRLDPKPIRWDYLNNPDRRDVFGHFRAMTHLKNNYDIFQTTDFQINTGGFQKTVHLNSDTMNLVAMGNFAVTEANVSPFFQHTGTWYEYFTGQTLEVTAANAALPLAAGEYRLYTDVPIALPEVFTDSREVAAKAGWAVFPNPVSDGFTVEISLEKSAPATLRIFDMQGRPQALLLDEVLPMGKLELHFDAVLPAGAYVLCLQTGDGMDCRKFFVVR